MKSSYDVTFADAVVGHVVVKKQGLYYCMECTTQIMEASKFRLIARSGEQEYDLGLCIPQDGGLHLWTRVPMKQFSDEPICFELLKKNPTQSGNFVPISANEPFSYLQRLETANLEFRSGTMGVVLQD